MARPVADYLPGRQAFSNVFKQFDLLRAILEVERLEPGALCPRSVAVASNLWIHDSGCF